jgi:hypothetical protein
MVITGACCAQVQGIYLGSGPTYGA